MIVTDGSPPVTASIGMRAKACGRHRLDRGVVVGAEHEFRLQTPGAEEPLDGLRAADRPEPDEALRRDGAERRVWRDAGGARTGGCYQHPGVSDKLNSLERAIGQRQTPECQIQAASLNKVKHAGVGRL
jgi:hypothetical protein